MTLLLLVSGLGCESKITLEDESPSKSFAQKKFDIANQSDENLLSIIFKSSYSRDIQGDYEIKYQEFPKQKTLKAPAFGYAWPDRFGGLAHRKSAAGIEEKTMYAPTVESEVYLKKDDEIKKLSPAEKYDIFMAEFDYPTVVSELERTRVRRTMNFSKDFQPDFNPPEWLSLRKAVAAVLTLDQLDFQNKVIALNPDLNITFQKDDLIGLAAWYFYSSNSPARILASRCSGEIVLYREALLSEYLRKEFLNFDEFYRELDSLSAKKPCLKLLSPSAFHLTILNEIGLNGRKMIFENIDYKFSVSGIVFSYDYESTKLSSELLGIEMNLEMMDPVSGKVQNLSYSYRLFYDAAGRIIGGYWTEGSPPDLIWNIGTKLAFSGYYGKIADLITP